MNYTKLPKGYKKIGIIDLDSKRSPQKRRVNLIAMILAVALAILGYQLHPFDEGTKALFEKVWVLMALLAVLFTWMVLREVVQGVAMRLLSGVKSRYAVRSLYVYAGSSAYFDRRSFVIISLAPALLFGLILAVLALVLPKDWFWLVMIVQIANIAGSASDFYSFARFLRFPKDALIQDLGTGMKVFGMKK